MSKKLFTISLSFFLPSVVFAQTEAITYTLLTPVAGVTSITSLTQYLDLIFRVLIGITGLLAVVMLVICGIKMMTTEAVSSKYQLGWDIKYKPQGQTKYYYLHISLLAILGHLRFHKSFLLPNPQVKKAFFLNNPHI
jgi:hypothetical protein